jgi:arabinogalactan endo-1,4-beta-galactosidase
VLELMRLAEPQRIAWLEAHLWPQLARIFAAVQEGVRSVDKGARFSTHVSGMTAKLPAQAVAFFKAMRKGGYDPDELGFSFYPSSSNEPRDRLGAFKRTVEAVHRELRKPVFLAEFGYPAGPPREGPFASWNHALEGYPLTPEGQAALLRDLAVWGAGAGLSGMRPWGPELAVPGWGPFALFTAKGKTATANPGLGAMAGVSALQ